MIEKTLAKLFMCYAQGMLLLLCEVLIEFLEECDSLRKLWIENLMHFKRGHGWGIKCEELKCSY